jgi:phospholipid/cholesterol/gamma-HCH transport system ATP-binding protein
MIRFDNVSKRFGNKSVLNNISFEVEKGETFFIVGLSGAGKSVTLKHMIKLLEPTEGAVFIKEESLRTVSSADLSRVRSHFGYLFQSAALLQWMTVTENVALPLKELTKMNDADIAERVADVLEKIGLGDSGDKYPSSISGGMQKRAGLARAIITEPEIILYDEPTSGLDPVTSRTIDALIDELRTRLQVTSVVVTHDMISALTIGSRIALLHLGDLIEISDPDSFVRSENAIVRSFLDSQHIDEDFLEKLKGKKR